MDGNLLRIAISWIPLSAFSKKQWKKWSKPVLISPPGVVDKSAALFPEEINGKYVIFHRIFPDILIDFVDSLDDFKGKTYLKGQYRISSPRKVSGIAENFLSARLRLKQKKDGFYLSRCFSTH